MAGRVAAALVWLLEELTETGIQVLAVVRRCRLLRMQSQVNRFL
jgi:hypothetical protein